MKNQFKVALGILSIIGAALASDNEVKTEYHGASWLQIGRVENSFTVASDNNNYNKNWMGNSGALLSISAKVDENWEGDLGLGSILVELARGAVGQAHKWYPFLVPFVDEAKIAGTWHPFGEDESLKLTIGNFHYGYNNDVKNFGLYLLHGYVYPGAIQSGFTGPLGVFASETGGMLSFGSKLLSNDLILNFETDDKPLYDMSIADVATLHLHSSFELGFGVNFYRAIPMDGKATSPTKSCDQNLLGLNASQGQENACYIIEKDTAGNPTDTVLGSLAGTKLMARFRLDPKVWFGISSMGNDEMVIYGEAAVLGLKNYPIFYNDIKRRIPVMVGFNVPTGNLFGLSLEAEYYASKISSDNLSAENGSWVPVQTPGVNYKRDDWKWSINASKLLFGHMVVLGQLADDHLRLGGNHDQATGIEAMRTPKDVYWTTKIAYFF